MSETNILRLSAALPESLLFSVTNPVSNGVDEGKPSYFDVTIKNDPNGDSIFEGMEFDGYCLDTDRRINTNTTYEAKVYSSYEQLPPELIEDDFIEKPENLDLVNWIINQCFVGKEAFDNDGNSLGEYTYGDVQRAIWALIDDQQSTGGLGSFNPERVEKIITLAQNLGNHFVPSYEYTTIFGEQVIGKMGVILVPDSNDDGLPDKQIVIVEVELSKLGDRLFFDLDSDGEYDTGEGIDGVDVKLLTDVDGDGTIEADEVIDTTTTTDDGMYMFEVIAGEYKVMVDTADLPEGYINTADPDNPPGDNDSMSMVTLTPGEYNDEQDFGYQAFDYGDAPDTYGTTNAQDGARHLLSNGQTSGAPVVKLGNLVDVEEDGQPNSTATGDDQNPALADDEDGVSFFSNTLKAGEKSWVAVNVMKMGTTQDAFLNAWVDFNGDGDFDADEQIFDDQLVNNGNQFLMFEVPDDAVGGQEGMTYARFRLSTQRDLSATGVAPDGEVEDYKVTIIPQEKASLGDFVWEDLDGDGIQNDNEPGVEGVKVTLTGGGEDGVIGTADDTMEMTFTDENGEYGFADLNPGEEYKVTFDPSTADPNFVFTKENQGGDDAADSDADPNNGMTQIVTLAPGENNPTLDAGLIKPASLGDLVWNDKNGNGIQEDGEPGVEGVKVTLTGGGADGVIGTADDTMKMTFTDENGEYGFNGLNPGEEYKVTFSELPNNFVGFTDANQGGDDAADSDADPSNGMTQIVTLESGEKNLTLDAGLIEEASLGDFVWEDLNGDGIQNDNEPGVKGVKVTLTGGGEDGVIGTADDTMEMTTTDSNGEYGFEGLNPGEEYKVTFDPCTADPNFVFTKQNQGGDDAADSDADPSNGMTQIVTLAPGENNPTLDAGLIKPASLGDFVWNDKNGNGIQDDGEPGVEGVKVTLTGGGADGVIGTADDTMKMTFTDENGEYGFDGLNPGQEYKVTFSELPNNFLGFTDANQGGDDAVDSDANPANGMTPIVTLKSGEENLTLDAGLIEKNPEIEIEKFVRVDENPIKLKKLVAVEPINAPEVGQAVCETEGKADAILFKYNPSSTVSTAQASDKAEIHTDNGLDGDGTSFIVVTDENDATKALNGEGKQFFRGDVAFGDAFLADESTDSFGSTTYIHFFNNNTGGLLQSVEYHTSCSQPIRLGDVIGNATLIGYDGDKDADISLTSIPDPLFVDANDAPGPETQIGTEVNFQYVVTNTGDVAITNVHLTDDRISDLTFVEGDTDGDKQLDTDETWIYSASEVAGEGLITNKGTVTGIVNGQTTIAMDMANYTGVEAPTGDIGTEGQVLCETEGKPEVMVFEYDPNVVFDTLQPDGKGGINPGSNVLDDDNNIFVVITDKSGASTSAEALTGETYFFGNVGLGEQFTASIFNAGTSSFNNNVEFYFFDEEGGPLLQSAYYHTSCSAPIILGDGILSAKLVGYDGVDGSLISLPAPEEPVEPPTTPPSVEIPQVDFNFDVNNIGVTGDSAPGPVANINDIVTFTYQVTNTGNVDLTINDLLDDNATPDDPSDDFTPTYVEGDDGDNIFNPQETWYFQAKELATRPGLNTNTIKVKATDGDGTMVMADDPANYIINPLDIEKYVAVEPMNPAEVGQAVCETEGKADAILFEYNPGSTVSTAQASDKAEIHTDNGVDDDGSSFVVVTDENDATKALKGDGKQFFRGDVAFGETFLADETTDSFGSTTYIHFFDESTGGLLQSVEYHTSCSQPIRLGDVIGNATLVGYDGENGDLVMIPDPVFVDADDPTGPQAIIGSEVQFQYVVTNLGDQALTDVMVSDDKLSGLKLIDQGDGDNLLGAGEQWIYAASELAKEGQQTNKATVIANLGNVQLMDMDSANYFGVEMPAPTGDVCKLFGDVVALTFKYDLEEKAEENRIDVVTGQDPSKAGVLTNNSVDDDGTSFIVVTDENDATKALKGDGKQFFRGNVAFGEFFQADESFHNDSFGSNTYIHFFDESTGGLLQSVNYHTSCSQPIEIGDVIGNATLAEYFGTQGAFDSPSIVPVEPIA